MFTAENGNRTEIDFYFFKQKPNNFTLAQFLWNEPFIWWESNKLTCVPRLSHVSK